MTNSKKFGYGVTFAILSSWPLGYVGVLAYVLLVPASAEYPYANALVGAFCSFGVASIAVAIIGVPLFFFLERRTQKVRTFLILGGMTCALAAYCWLFWGVGGTERLELILQATITASIGGLVAAILGLIAQPNNALHPSLDPARPALPL